MAVSPVITQIINKLTLEISPEIQDKCVERTQSLNFDDFLQNVILKIVNIDLSGRVGKKTEITIKREWMIRHETLDELAYSWGDSQYIGIYSIPAYARFHKDIISAEYPDLSGYAFGGVGSYGGVGFTNTGISVNSLSNDLVESRTFQHSPPRPSVDIIESNNIKVYPDIYFGSDFRLICKLSYDGSYTNANVNFIVCLKDLVVLALKRWIHAQLIVKIDVNEVNFGQELGVFKEIVSGYGDLEQAYEDKLTQCVRANDWDKTIYRRRLLMTI